MKKKKLEQKKSFSYLEALERENRKLESMVKKYGDREINLRWITPLFKELSIEDTMWIFGKVLKSIEDPPVWSDDKVEEFFEGATIEEIEQFDTAWEDFISRKREHEDANKKRIPGEPDRNRYSTGPDEYDPNRED